MAIRHSSYAIHIVDRQTALQKAYVETIWTSFVTQM